MWTMLAQEDAAASAIGGDPGGVPAPLVVIGAIILFALALRYYARYISARLFNLEDDETPPPSVTMEDGVDYVPTERSVVFGHHFVSIAGAAPIVGPALAVVYGWLPPLLWIIFGVIFMGAMQDFGSLAVSMRNRGRSIGDLAAGIISGRARTLFLLIVLFLAWIVLAVFAMVIANLFVTYPESVVPINSQIVIAVAIGLLIYRLRTHLLWPSLVALVIMYVLVIYFAGYSAEDKQIFRPSSWPVFAQMADSYAQSGVAEALVEGDLTAAEIETVRADRTRAFDIMWWVAALMLYSFAASVLPVWVLLQPRDYINSHQLVLAMGLTFIGFFIAWPTFSAPAINEVRIADAATKPVFPFLFVTVACGAISGFHALVASGTTSKQVKSFKDARVIGYGGMLGEGTLALLATVACAAGVSSVYYNNHYASYGSASGLTPALTIFVQGCANMLSQLYVPVHIGKAVVVVMVISFAATTLDSATRIMRYIVHELGDAYKIKPLENRYTATGFAVGAALVLAFWTPGGRGGLILWPLFGSVNQLTAALALMVVALYLYRTEKPMFYYLIPMLFVAFITLNSMIREFKGFMFPETFLQQPNYLLGTISGIIIILDVWLILEGAAVLFGKKRPLRQSFVDVEEMEHAPSEVAHEL